jgi:Glutamyl-tRNA reductase
MASLAAAHLKKRAPADLVIMNRSLENAEMLAAKYGARCRPWAEFNPAVLEADLIIAATGAQSPILTLESLGNIMALRGSSKPLTIIDIGVPRNAGHDLKRLSNVILRNIDDLNEVVWENKVSRKEAADKAESIIDEEVDKFGQWLKSLASQPMVTALTIKAETIRRNELQRTLSQHSFSPDQQAALEVMTSALVRRLLHDPLAFIKQSGSQTDDCQGRQDECAPKERCLRSIRRAFNIDADKAANFDNQ